MRHVDLLRRVEGKNRDSSKKKKRESTSVDLPKEVTVTLESPTLPVKTSEDFILSETAKSIPESLEENTEKSTLPSEEKTVVSKKKTFPKKKKED